MSSTTWPASAISAATPTSFIRSLAMRSWACCPMRTGSASPTSSWRSRWRGATRRRPSRPARPPRSRDSRGRLTCVCEQRTSVRLSVCATSSRPGYSSRWTACQSPVFTGSWRTTIPWRHVGVCGSGPDESGGAGEMVALSLMIEGQNGLTWPYWKRLVAVAESLGVAALFRSDHYTNASPPDKPSLETIVSLTYAADHTSRIHFGPLVAPLSFREPTMLARQAAVLDDLSGGRGVLGLGAGRPDRAHDLLLARHHHR